MDSVTVAEDETLPGAAAAHATIETAEKSPETHEPRSAEIDYASPKDDPAVDARKTPAGTPFIPTDLPRNKEAHVHGSSSRGVAEALRGDSPVLPGMFSGPVTTQAQAAGNRQTRSRGFGKQGPPSSGGEWDTISAHAHHDVSNSEYPTAKDGLGLGAVIGGGIGGAAGLAIAHHVSGSDTGKELAHHRVLQEGPRPSPRRAPLSQSYAVVYDGRPSYNTEALHSMGKDKERGNDYNFRPKNDVSLKTRKSLLNPLNVGQERTDTPPIVLPTLSDLPPPRPLPQPQPRQLRRARKMSIARAEEEIAAAVVIYASADAISPQQSPTHEYRGFDFPVDAGPSKEPASAAGLQDSRMDSPDVTDPYMGDEDLRQSVADLFTDHHRSSDDKDRDRHRDGEHRLRRRPSQSHHRHRRSRHDGESSESREGRESRRHSYSSSHSNRHHRSRADSERSSRTPPDSTPPRTPTRSHRRQDSGYGEEYSERSHHRRRRRSPEDQAEHERRRERRLREKERESERDRRESRDGDRERHRRSRPGTSRSNKEFSTDDSPPKKFLDMEHSRGVLAGPAPKDAPPPPPSSRGDLPRRSNTTRERSGRSRRSEDVSGRSHRTRTGDERPRTGDDKLRRRSDDRLRSDDKMRSEDKMRSNDRLGSDERLGSSDRLPRKGEGEGSRGEEARRKARQEERMRAREKDDEKKSGFRAAFKRIFN